MEKQVALIGASGYVGNAILHELLQRGWHVRALVRHPHNITIKNPLLSVEKVDVGDETQLTLR